MKKLLLFVLPLLSAFASIVPAPRAGEPPAIAATADSVPAESHPVKGVVMGLLPDRQALLVKHEAVPGVMRAMTMMFKVESDVLTRVKEGDAIAARMARREDGWWLIGVQVINPTK